MVGDTHIGDNTASDSNMLDTTVNPKPSTYLDVTAILNP